MNTFEKLQPLAEWKEQRAAILENVNATLTHPIQPSEDADVTAVPPVQPGPMLADEDADINAVHPIPPDEDVDVTVVNSIQPGLMLASSETPDGNDFSAMFDALAQFDRDLIRERTHAGLAPQLRADEKADERQSSRPKNSHRENG